MVSRLRHAKAGPLGAGNAARRRERREVGVRMGLPCHDGEVEGVVMDYDAVLVLGIRGSARYAQAHVPNEATMQPLVPLALQFTVCYLP